MNDELDSSIDKTYCVGFSFAASFLVSAHIEFIKTDLSLPYTTTRNE